MLQAENILEQHNNKKLAEIYDEINKLEKTEIEEKKYYNYDEKYRPLAYYFLQVYFY